MTQLITQHLIDDAYGIETACAVLQAGGLAALPTETVYGLAANACDSVAVAKIYEAKGRPSFNPLICHVFDVCAACKIGVFDAVALQLADAFWPGPLTLVVPQVEGSDVATLVTAGLQSVAIRVPAHPIVREILQSVAVPLAAPSANPSGRVSPTTAAHVLAGLDGRIDAVLDGGSCAVGVESTIVSCLGPTPVLLREGGVTAEAIEAVLGADLVRSTDVVDAPVAPGQLPSHYAPRGTVRLNAAKAGDGETLVGFGSVAGDLTLSAKGDLTEAAARLFDVFHQLDAMGARKIAVAPVPEEGLGRAINDRLRRAAAPR